MARRYKKKTRIQSLLATLLFLVVFGLAAYYQDELISFFTKNPLSLEKSYAMSEVPDYFGKAYVVLDNNVPNFSEEDLQRTTFESYSELDKLNRCGVAFALVSKETMPNKEREGIGMIKPSGWHTVKYDNVDGKYLYNRCHLIGYQLTGENANPKNLITCTREMNTTSMLSFENEVASYVKKTGNHVLYRVTPYFYQDNLVASGVEMEAMSVEDKGKGLSYHVYVYNVQEGITIDYKTGESKLKGAS